MIITLQDFMETVSYKITDSSEYLWRCYGPDARSMDAVNGEGGYGADTVCIVFDTKNQTVYEMQAWDHDNDREYRWIHPDYKKAYKKESKSRGLKHRESFDDRKFIDLELPEDILTKSMAIFNKEEYDTRILVPLELGDEEMLQLMRLAHEADMTLNDFVAKLLMEEIERRS